METDRPLKVLFERQGQSLLPFLGEHRGGARVTAAETIELPVSKRTIDSVLRLERDGLVWYREWRFDVVRLWEIDAQSALRGGEAGPLALVPLLKGGDDPARVLEAARRLDAMPRAQARDAMPVLLDFAAQRYDRATFLNVLGKDPVMQSWLSQDRAENAARAELEAVRQVCSDLVREFHPGVAAGLMPAIEGCEQAETLRSWTLQCARLSDEAFVTLLTGKPPVRTARSRTTRPSRGSTKRR